MAPGPLSLYVMKSFFSVILSTFYLPSGHDVVSHYSHTKHKMLISTHNIISR